MPLPGDAKCSPAHPVFGGRRSRCEMSQPRLPARRPWRVVVTRRPRQRRFPQRQRKSETKRRCRATPGCATAIERDLKKWLSFKVAVLASLQPDFKVRSGRITPRGFPSAHAISERPLGGLEAWRGLLFTVFVSRQPE